MECGSAVCAAAVIFTQHSTKVKAEKKKKSENVSRLVGFVVWFGVDEGVYNPKNIFGEKTV